MPVFSPDEFEQLFGGTEQPLLSSEQDYANRFVSGFGHTLVADPIAGLGRLMGGDNALTTAGEATGSFIDTLAPVDPSYTGIDRDLASGAGSLAGFLAGGVGGAMAKLPAAGVVVPGALGITGQSEAGYQDARAILEEQSAGQKAFGQPGIDPAEIEQQAISSARWNAPVGSLEALPVGRVFGRAAGSVADVAENFATKVLKETVKGALEEGAQEGVTQLGSNVVAKDIVGYDPNRDRTQEVGYNALLGAILGAPVSGVATVIGGGGEAQRQQENLPAPLTGEVLPPVTSQPSQAPMLPPPGPQTIDGTANRPAAEQPIQQPQDIAAQAAPEPVSEPQARDWNKALDGEEPVLIRDDKTGTEVEGYYHEGANKVRKVGQPAHENVLAAQPVANTESVQQAQQANTVEAMQQQGSTNAAQVPQIGNQAQVQPVDGPIVDKFVAMPKRSTAPRQKPLARPAAFYIRQMGGIDPDSPLARELNSRDITPRTFPGLFRRGGMKALDNIPRNEVDIFGAAGDGIDVGNERQYVGQDEWVAALEAEFTGNPYRNQDEAVAQADSITGVQADVEADYRKSEEEARNIVEREFTASGFDAVPADVRNSIARHIADGRTAQEAADLATDDHFKDNVPEWSDALDAIPQDDLDYWVDITAGRVPGRQNNEAAGQQQFQPEDPPFALPERSREDGGRTGETPESQRTGERSGGQGGSELSSAEVAAGKPAVATEEAGADNRPQAVLPGFEKASDKDLAQRRADAPLRPNADQRQMDIGMFGSAAQQQELPGTSTQSKTQTDTTLDTFLSVIDEIAGKPDAGQRQTGNAAPRKSRDQIASEIDNLLKEDEATLAGAPEFDNNLYESLKPLLRDGLAQSNGATVREQARDLVGFLAKKGLSRDKLVKLAPYMARFTDDVNAGKESLDVPGSTGNLEPDSGTAAAPDRMGATDVPASERGDGRGAGERRGETGEGIGQQDAGNSVPEGDAASMGTQGDLIVPRPEPEPVRRADADGQSGTGSDGGVTRPEPDPTTAKAVAGTSSRSASVEDRKAAQKSAEKIPVKPGIDNIRATLPMLHKGQQEDVHKTEQRFEKAHGMLLTNGTGTGKTFSGLGVVKRFARQGKKNILIVAPSQGILEAWKNSAPLLGLDVSILDSTKDKGAGIVATTYANFGQNRDLADRDWDLIVTDEAHKLSSNAQGDVTAALRSLRAYSNHPTGYRERAFRQLRKEYDKYEKIRESGDTERARAAYEKLLELAKPLEEKFAKQDRTKVLMLSATPFAHHFSLDYAEGYLFDYPASKNEGGYNNAEGREKFYVENLGYRMRYNKLTKPDADVDAGIMERELVERMKKDGAVSGRMLDVARDYDRKFVTVNNAEGRMIDRAFEWMQQTGGGRYYELSRFYGKRFDYISRARLLEAIKARESVPLIQQHLDMGRKVLVFHNYNEGGGFHVFPPVDSNQEVRVGTGKEAKNVKLKDLYREFLEANPYIEDLNFRGYQAPILELTKAFGNRARTYNGTVSGKNRSKNLADFNAKDSGVDLLVVQADAGEAGLSAHDTVGDTPRVMINLGLPTKPVTAIQQEGRIFRDGQASDAMFRYLNTGTTWERMAFAATIAQRASTAENLALGNEARTLKQSFIDAYMDSGDWKPGFDGEGTGGKEIDRASREALTDFDRAITHYFGNQKRNSNTKSREGVDYFATPEPIGVKMIEWADIKPGEKVLEPSAGHGAIARYFPEQANKTIVEPSADLISRAMMYAPDAKPIQDRFENLNIVNKYDAIIMNPPFGTGGKTAIDHLDKAAKHLRNGGRIVALIPTGPAADKRFDKWWEGSDMKDFALVRDIALPSVTFERAGTSVMTRIVVIEKQKGNLDAVANSMRRDYTNATTINDLFDRIRDAEIPGRAEPLQKEMDVAETGKVTAGGIEFEIEAANENGENPALKIRGYIGDRFAHVAETAKKHGGEYAAGALVFETIDGRTAFLQDIEANPKPKPAAAEDIAGVKFKIDDAYNKKRMKNVKVAQIDGRVPRDQYQAILEVAKRHGGYYSSFKGEGAVPGFQFETAEARQKFMDEVAGGGLAEDERALAAAEEAKQARDIVLELGKRDGKEHLIFINNGERLASHTDGKERMVLFTPEQKKMIMDGANDVVGHHNHPTSSSLSNMDLAQLSSPGLAAIYAHGHSGNWFRAAFPDSMRELVRKRVGRKAQQDMARDIQRVADGVNRVVNDYLQKVINDNNFYGDTEEFQIIIRNSKRIVNEALSRAGFIVYHHSADGRVEVEHDHLREALAKAEAEAVIQTAQFRRIYNDGTGNEAGVYRPAEYARYPGDLAEVVEGTGRDAGRRTGQGEPDPAGKGADPRKREDGEPPQGLSEETPEFKPASGGNWHVPDRGTFTVLRDGNLALMKRLRAAVSKEAVMTSIDNFREKMQDRFLPMLRVEQAIEKKTGKALPEEMQAYLAEELYSGRAGARLDRIEKRYLEPISFVMRDAGISEMEVSEYLYARHAKERNARIADINPEMTDGGSGMTGEEADQILADVAASDNADAFDTIGRLIDRMMRESVRFRVESGLLSEEMADKWNEFEHYVPLRGFEDISEEDPGVIDRPTRTGSGYTVRGPESKRALGRESRAGDVLATAFAVAQEAVIRGEKNRVVQRFYELVQANPNKEYWQINPYRTRKIINQTTGLVYSRAEPIAATEAHRTVSVKFNGVEKRIVLNDKRLQETLRRLNPEDLNGILKVLSGVNRYLSTMNTTLNPEFLVSNAIRDLQTAVVHMETLDQKGLTRDVLRDYRAAMAGAWGGLRGKSLTTEWRKWFREFELDGGKVSFFRMEDITDLNRKIGSMSKNLSASDYRRVWRGVKAVGKYIEDMNLAVDNAVRLALYKNLRERGVSRDKAASAAKNITVNFNRRGQYATTMNALYLFYNAGVQGTAIMANAMKHKNARRLAGGMVMGALALDLLNALFLADDDENGENEYDKIPDYVKQRNLVVMLPGAMKDGQGQGYIKIPLPYGYNVFHSMGRNAGAFARGAQSGAESLSDLFVTFAESFNPVGGSDSILKMMSPTIGDPIVEMVENRDFAGRPIRPERDRFNANIPKSQDYYNSVSPISRHLAKMLNDWTGGNDFKPGMPDISPEWIDHGAKFLGGAAVTSWWRPINTATKLASGQEISSNDIPFVRKVHGRTGAWVERDRYYSRVNEIEAAYEQVKGFSRRGDAEAVEGLDDRTKALASLRTKAYSQLRDKMKDIRAERNRIYSAPYSASERSARLKSLEGAESRLISNFNSAYLKAVSGTN